MMPLGLVLLPLISAGLMPSYRGLAVRRISAAGAGATFLLSLAALVRLKAPVPPSETAFSWSHVDLNWIPSLGIRFHLSLDGLAAAFCLLAGTVFLASVLAAVNPQARKRREQLTALLVSEAGAMCAVMAQDAMVALWGWIIAWVPMAAITALCGQDRRAAKASRRMALHLLAATFLILAAIVALAAHHRFATGQWSFDLTRLYKGAAEPSGSLWILIALLLGSGSAVTLFPVHTWLPSVLSTAPGPVGAALTGATVKVGFVFLLRIGLPLLPAAHQTAAWPVAVLCLVGVGHAGLLAWTYRRDLRTLMAYSTVGLHGLALMGLLSLDIRGTSGCIFLLVAGGLGSSAIWLAITGLDERLPGWKPGQPGGLVRSLPRLAGLCLLATACLVGVPGFAGFVGQILVYTGAFDAYTTFAIRTDQLGTAVPMLLAHPKLFTLIAIVAGLSIPAALLVSLHQTFLTPSTLRPERKPPDAGGQLLVGMLLAAAFCLVLGWMPNWLLSRVDPSSRQVIARTAEKYTRPARTSTPRPKVADRRGRPKTRRAP
jgi:NADH-quinone oxidoreductase subunit M